MQAATLKSVAVNWCFGESLYLAYYLLPVLTKIICTSVIPVVLDLEDSIFGRFFINFGLINL